MQATPLSGGQMTSVIKIGNTVRRSATQWTPAVRQLLEHLEAVKFEGVPRVLGTDSEGREILSFIDGEAGYLDSKRNVPANLWSDEVLMGAAQLLRRYHDATANFTTAPGTHWQFSHPNPQLHEVICHNDFAPWNTIFVDSKPHAVIDFDTAGPGPRIDDIAYAAYCFAPLFREEKCLDVGLKVPPDYGHKLKAFCNAYGSEYCDGIVDAIIARIEGARDWVVREAESGDIRFQRKVEEGHVASYNEDLTFLHTNRAKLQNHLGQG